MPGSSSFSVLKPSQPTQYQPSGYQPPFQPAAEPAYQGYQPTDPGYEATFPSGLPSPMSPPLDAGVLDGRLRADLIAQGLAREAVLTPADLAGEVWFGNSLRGLVRAVKP